MAQGLEREVSGAVEFLTQCGEEWLIVSHFESPPCYSIEMAETLRARSIGV
jgi:hypothetical protein